MPEMDRSAPDDGPRTRPNGAVNPLPRAPGDGARGPLAKKLLHREKEEFLRHFRSVGRVTACELVGITYSRFLREIRTNPEFARDVRDVDAMKDELAESVIYNGVLNRDIKAATAWLNHRLRAKKLNLDRQNARLRRKIMDQQARLLGLLEGAPRDAHRFDLSRLTVEQLHVLEESARILESCSGPSAGAGSVGIAPTT
jgi:hypothetical protein